jgi:hypothetical protein
MVAVGHLHLIVDSLDAFDAEQGSVENLLHEETWDSSAHREDRTLITEVKFCFIAAEVWQA